MRRIVDKILWGILLVFFGPTVMIVASWNALPGDNLYGVKLALERTALTLASPSYATAGTLQIKYTERRYAEAKQLLASKQSIQGLPYLQQQIAETKKAIESAPNKETQVTLAKQYINTLQTVATELEEQKTAITTSPQPVAYVPPRSNAAGTFDVPPQQQAQSPQTVPSTVPPPTQQQATVTPTPSPTSGPRSITTIPSPKSTPTPPSSPTPSPSPTKMAQVATSMPIPAQHAVVALQIDQTQQNVNQTIADLQTLVEDREQKHEDKERKKEKKTDDDKTRDKKSKRDD